MKQRAKPSRFRFDQVALGRVEGMRIDALALQRGQHAAAAHAARSRARRCCPPISTATLPKRLSDVFMAPATAPSSTMRAATWPIEPAPITITTSPPRACASTALGQAVDLVDEDRIDLAGQAQRARQRAAVGGNDRRLAGRVDLGQQHRVGAAQDLDEVLEAVAGAGVAVRLEGQHQALAREGAARRGDHRRHLDRVVAVVVDQR